MFCFIHRGSQLDLLGFCLHLMVKYLLAFCFLHLDFDFLFVSFVFHILSFCFVKNWAVFKFS